MLSQIASLALGLSAPVTVFENGLWWTGESFEPRTVHVEGSHFVEPDNREPQERVDLDGAYVVPPYCDAHAHSIGRSPQLPEITGQYLAEGVFYVREIGNFPPYRAELDARLAAASAPDLAFTGAPLTAPGGHPVEVYQRLQQYAGLFGELVWEEMDGTAFHQLPDQDSFERAWPGILATQPAAIKVHLLYSEAFEARRDHPQTVGQRGLDPALLPEIVARAHAAGIPVLAHVETAADFRNAIAAGVDEIAHMPGYNGPSVGPYDRALTDEDAEAAAAAGVVVHTTLSFAAGLESRNPERYAATRDLQQANLARLVEAGVTLVVGSDDYSDTSVDEVAYLSGLDVLEPAHLLTMWTSNCTQAVFPDRQIGHLQPGHEASFLVLEGDPLADFEQTRAIREAWREGVRIQGGGPE
ncbi:amidohydrolase family protein [Maricaulis parjimensis]|uniref:amidohydrolase family protein n=1 Tax=Maricaulis parjimensis TaxID=144023 RepID=UPI00193A318A|nr:amidohydrolase family protein [Maricaulis parjimensis]